MRGARGLAPLAHPRFRLLFAGQLASNLGDLAYAVALPLYVLAHHGGPVLLGVVLAAYGVPRTVLVAIGGSLSDRLRPWNVMLAADATRVLAVAALAVAASAGPARALVLVPIAILLGGMEGLFLPASMAILPELVPTEALQSANALSQGGSQLATLLGPALGGLLVALAGPSIAFWMDAASFAISALTLAAIRQRSRPVSAEVPTEIAAMTEPPMRLRALLVAEPVLVVMLVVTLAANLGAGGMGEVALPDLVYRVLHGGARGYGFLIAALGAGGLIGAIVAAQARRPRRPAVASSVAFLVAGAALFAIPLARTLPEAIVLVGILGFPLAFGNVVMGAATQAWAPPHLLGRLMSVFMLTGYGAFPVSVLVAGFVVRSFGPASFFVFTGVTLAIAVSFALALPSWRSFASAPAADAPPIDPEPLDSP